MAIGRFPNFRNLRRQLDLGGGLPSLTNLPIAKKPIEMATPVAKNPIEMGMPSTQWWANDGYNSIQEAIQSGNYTFKMGEGFVKNPDAVTPAMEEAAAAETVTVTDMDGNPVEPPVSAVLENIGTSATTPPAEELIEYRRSPEGPVSYMTQAEIDEEQRIDAEKAAGTYVSEIGEPEKMDPSIKYKTVIDPVTKAITQVPVDPVTEAVETAVGGGATTTAPATTTTPPVEEIIAPTMAPPEIEKIEQAIAQLPPAVIPEIIPQLPPAIIPEIIPQLPPEVIAQVVPQLPPEVIQQLPPEIVADPVTTAVNAAVGGGSTATAPPPATMGASSSADLGTLGTSGVATMDSPPVQMGGQTITLPGGQTIVIPSQEEIMANIAKMGGEPEVVQETAQTETLIDPVTAAVNQATGNTQEKVGLPYDGEPQVTVDVPQTETLIDPVTAAVNQAAGNTEETTVDPVTAAVDAAVGGGQSTTDKNPFGFGGENYYSGEGFIRPPPDAMVTQATVAYYNPSTGQTYSTSTGGYTVPPGWVRTSKEGYEGNKEYYDNMLAGQGTDTGTGGTGTGGTGTDTGTGTGGGAVDAPVGEQEPDFMTQLQELIAQMQGEQTTAAEAQAAAQAAEQQRINEMSQNYVVGGSAMGYNPYMSGQYQSNPYGPAGAPDMGGITSIPVPAPLQNFEPPQDQPSAMEMFNAGYQSPRTTTST